MAEVILNGDTLQELDRQVLRAVDAEIVNADEGLDILLAANEFNNKLLQEESRDEFGRIDQMIAEEEANLMNAMRGGQASADQTMNALLGITVATKVYKSATVEG